MNYNGDARNVEAASVVLAQVTDKKTCNAQVWLDRIQLLLVATVVGAGLVREVGVSRQVV